MYPVYPTIGAASLTDLIYGAAFIILLAAMIVCALTLPKRREGRRIRVHAIVTQRWEPSGDALPGFREHTYRVFAKWTDPQTDITYHFAKQSHHPLDSREGDLVPATIDLEHPGFRHLDV
jgi:hypothetical protein